MNITFTDAARDKTLEIKRQEAPEAYGLRIRITGGGCAGFQYNMFFEESAPGEMDKVFSFGALSVLVDMLSLQYLNGTTIDYVETEAGGGFKFLNPQIKSTCGCGQSFRT